jgi:hypothetical protein
MGNFMGSCFARPKASDGGASSSNAAKSIQQNFFSPHSDAINCVVTADDDSFLSCSDDKSVSLINAAESCVQKRWDVGHAVQRCWWGNHQLSLAADRGGQVSWLVNHDGTCKIGGTGSHKLTVNALAGDMQQVCPVSVASCRFMLFFMHCRTWPSLVAAMLSSKFGRCQLNR